MINCDKYWLFLLILVTTLKLNAQVIDTLFYFNEDSVGNCGYILDVYNIGVLFELDSSWDSYDIIEVQFQVHWPFTIPSENWMYFHLTGGSNFPGEIIDSVLISIEDSTEMYPNWITVNVSSLNSLKNISGSFSITSFLLKSYLCDSSPPSGNSYWYSYQQQTWSIGPDFPLKAIVQKSTVGISEDNRIIPSSYQIFDVFPNPFNSSTTIIYEIQNESYIKLHVYDLMGRLLDTLVDSNQPAGNYSILWSNPQFASGIYLIVLETSESTTIRKVLLLK